MGKRSEQEAEALRSQKSMRRSRNLYQDSGLELGVNWKWRCWLALAGQQVGQPGGPGPRLLFLIVLSLLGLCELVAHTCHLIEPHHH